MLADLAKQTVFAVNVAIVLLPPSALINGKEMNPGMASEEQTGDQGQRTKANQSPRSKPTPRTEYSDQHS